MKGLTNPGGTRTTKYLVNSIFHNYQNFCEDGKQKLVMGSYKVMLEEETGFVDFSAGRLSVPRLGHQQLFSQGDGILTHFSMDFGRLYFSLEEEVNEGFKLASNNATSIEYEDKTLVKAGLPVHPNLLVVDVSLDSCWEEL